MRAIASPRIKPSSSEAGFTLTELIAGLLVASMVIVGLAEVTRRYSQTTVRARDIANELRTASVVEGLMRELERADPGSLEVTRERVTARLGTQTIEASLHIAGQFQQLDWRSPAARRSLLLPAGAHFDRTSAGAVALYASASEPPMAVVRPQRTIPYDCQFDSVSRVCR